MRDHNLTENVGEDLELLLWDSGDISWHRAGEKDTLSTSVQNTVALQNPGGAEEAAAMDAEGLSASPVEASISPHTVTAVKR